MTLSTLNYGNYGIFLINYGSCRIYIINRSSLGFYDEALRLLGAPGQVAVNAKRSQEKKQSL